MRSPRVLGKTAGDWLILRSLRSKMCLSPFLRGFETASSVALVAAVSLAVAGCGSSGSASSEEIADYGKVRMMIGFYEGYLKDHRGQSPANQQAFRDYLSSKHDNLEAAGITLDQMFLSPRDGKPMQWVYGRRPPVLRQNNMTCYAYETEPVAGKHLVIGGRGMSAEVDESQFRTLFPNKS
jgi:hypothetical protein